MTNRELLPALIVPFIAWRVYRRVKRNIGRQPFRPVRLGVSIGIFSTVVLLFAAVGMRHPPVLAALGGGVLVSVALAWYGLGLTKFETTPEGRFYTPNTALGIAITVLFVGRLAYRMVTVAGAPHLADVPVAPPFQSPLTYFLFGLTAGYYIAYYAGVLIRGPRTAT